ncbi:hypothetical protein [Sneathia sanguinegens]|uniref:hypothetical protein n=1 Tax=Sneathia sanguinegens TaxID=40543 RepID=UPI0023F7320F|nr:hypothetical protein [Sneathia sanguinegens]
MKKTLLLTSLVASMVSIARTTGLVEGYNENEATFVKDAKPTFVAKKTGVKIEVKVNGTGFSFGGDFKAENLELGNVTRANYLNHSSVWVKYELPELKGVKSYVKATVSPKFDEQLKTYDLAGLQTKLSNAQSELAEAEANFDNVADTEDNSLIQEAFNKVSTARKNMKNLESELQNANNLKTIPAYIDKGSADLEGQVSYKYGEFTFGLNSKTNFPLSNE